MHCDALRCTEQSRSAPVEVSAFEVTKDNQPDNNHNNHSPNSYLVGAYQDDI
jgi:hypothetical protein